MGAYSSAVQAAMTFALVQVPLLESYLQSPQVHINASTNPECAVGSSSISRSQERELRELLATIKRDRADMLESLQQWPRQKNSCGAARQVRPLAAVPQAPRRAVGAVEIAYDTSNQPAVRFIDRWCTKAASTRGPQSVQLSLETGRAPVHLEHTRLSSPEVLDLRIRSGIPELEELICYPHPSLAGPADDPIDPVIGPTSS